jgi:hypothetical protein
MKTLISIFILAAGISQVHAEEKHFEYFISPDGGTFEQCTGLVKGPYSEEVEEKECALKHMYELLDPQFGEVRLKGDTNTITILNQIKEVDGVLIEQAAEYIMGSQEGYELGECAPSQSYACIMPTLPSGTVLRGHQENESCDIKPILSGTKVIKHILVIDGVSDVSVNCLTIQDKSSCISAGQYPEGSLICDRTPPFEDRNADVGIFMQDASNIKLTDLNIKGLVKGIHAGRISNTTLTDVNLYANSEIGWDGDIASNDNPSSGNSGTIRFINSSITFSGCGLIYDPSSDKHDTPHACANENIGGYGDGIGTGETGADWVFENVKIMHNNSDGIDLLYHTLGGKITVRNSHFEGNAGNQLKVSGNSEIVNNVIIGNCGWNSRQEPKVLGSIEESIGEYGEKCRAAGNTLAFAYTHEDTRIDIINNTILSEGDVILSSTNRTGVADVSQTLNVVNNILYGLPDFLQPFENTGLYYTDAPFVNRRIHNNIIHMPKSSGDPCNTFITNSINDISKTHIPPGATENLCTTSGTDPYYDNEDHNIVTNPIFQEIRLGIVHEDYNINKMMEVSNILRPQKPTSPLIDSGYSKDDLEIPDIDYLKVERVGIKDIGAIEYIPIPNSPIILELNASEM